MQSAGVRERDTTRIAAPLIDVHAAHRDLGIRSDAYSEDEVIVGRIGGEDGVTLSDDAEERAEADDDVLVGNWTDDVDFAAIVRWPDSE